MSFGDPETQRNVLYIKEQVKHIKEQYDEVILQKISVDQFWQELAPLLLTLTGQKQYKEIIGNNVSKDLKLFSINLSASMATYREAESLGQRDRSKDFEKDLVNTMGQVVERLDTLDIDVLSQNTKKDISINQVITNSETPARYRFFPSKYFSIAAVGVAIIIVVFFLYPHSIPMVFQPPIAEDQSVNTWENKAVFINLKAIDSNGPISYSISSYPRNGKISEFNLSTGSLIYNPAINYSGNDNFTFEAKNSKTDKSDGATVSIIIKRLIQNKSIESNIISDNITPSSSNNKEIIGLKYKTTLIPEQLRSPNLKSFTHGVTVEINTTKPIMEKIANVTYFGKEGFTTLASNQEVSNSPTDNFRISFNALDGFPLYAKVYFKDNHIQNLATNIVLK